MEIERKRTPRETPLGEIIGKTNYGKTGVSRDMADMMESVKNKDWKRVARDGADTKEVNVSLAAVLEAVESAPRADKLNVLYKIAYSGLANMPALQELDKLGGDGRKLIEEIARIGGTTHGRAAQKYLGDHPAIN